MNFPVASRLVLALLCLFVVGVVIQHPLVTNDGPVHVAFSDMLAHLHQPGRELQREAYDIVVRLTPNLLIYLIMAPLIAVFGSVHLAESVVQALCLLGPMVAGWLALRTVNRANAWLAVFIFPLSLNEMFFLGLYNYCLSTAIFLLAVAAAWHLLKAPSAGRALLLSLTLCFSLVTHAAGFVAAFTGLGAMSATFVVLAMMRGDGFVAAALRQRYLLVALALPLPLLLLASSTGAGGAIEYGPNLWLRFLTMARLLVLRLGGGFDSSIAAVLAVALLALCAWVLFRFFGRSAGQRPPQSAARDLAIATTVALAVSVLVMFAFPDTLGGGWTHFRRFVIFPFFWILVLAAQQDFALRPRWALFGFATAVALALFGSTVTRESTVRAQMAPFADVDRLVGNHCTVLPLIFETRPIDRTGQPLPLTYNPYFQAASRFEQRGDRVVLFNYLARLVIYPVNFKRSVEPQSLLFGWTPQQQKITVDSVDVPRFERQSGLHVDYMVLVGDIATRPLALQREVEALKLTAQRIYTSADRRVTLYRRAPGAGSLCVPQNPGSATASPFAR